MMRHSRVSKKKNDDGVEGLLAEREAEFEREYIDKFYQDVLEILPNLKEPQRRALEGKLRETYKRSFQEGVHAVGRVITCGDEELSIYILANRIYKYWGIGR